MLRTFLSRGRRRGVRWKSSFILSREPDEGSISHLDPKYMEAHNRLVGLVQNFGERSSRRDAGSLLR